MHTQSTQGSDAHSAVLPRRVQILRVITSRYGTSAESARPSSWDERVAGVDVCEMVNGETIRLVSTPMQSPPKPGWILMLTEGDSERGYGWTLYGIGQCQ